jgi:hypothetical protein
VSFRRGARLIVNKEWRLHPDAEEKIIEKNTAMQSVPAPVPAPTSR